MIETDKGVQVRRSSALDAQLGLQALPPLREHAPHHVAQAPATAALVPANWL
jgi:hypothetical protein